MSILFLFNEKLFLRKSFKRIKNIETQVLDLSVLKKIIEKKKNRCQLDY